MSQNATRSARPVAKTPTVATEVHPHTLPWTSAITTAARPRPTVITPGMSIRPAAVSSRCSAVDASTRTTPSRQNGRFSQNSQRQLTASTSAPPTSGPMPNASADTPAQIPSARARSPAGKTVETIASDRPKRAAPPMP